jgi:hypothetical protein
MPQDNRFAVAPRDAIHNNHTVVEILELPSHHSRL